MRLSLRHKGLLLVIVPLVFQLVFVATLLSLLQHADREVRKAAHARDVHSAVNAFINSYQSAAFALVNYAITKSAAMEKRYTDSLEQISVSAGRLRRLAAESSRKEEGLASISGVNDQLVRSLGEAYNSVASNVPVDAATKTVLLNDMSVGIKQGFSRLQAFADEEYQLNRFDPEAEAKARELVVQCLFVGVVASILIAVALSLLFSNNIVTRISVMVDNAKKLVSKKPLNPIVSGSDEITFLDSTMHKMAEDLNEAAQRKQELMSMVSHDLRSPLTSVSASLQLVSQEILAPLPEAVKSELSVCSGGVSRLIRLINDLLDMEKIEAGRMELVIEYVNLKPILIEACDALRGIASRRSVNMEVDCPRIKVIADRERVVQMLVNLLANALKYSPTGAKVLLRARRAEGIAHIEVVDEGKGISPENQMKLFKRFEQVDAPAQRQSDSTGLGLAICQQLVQMQNGQIGVASQEGGGCTFWFTLPLAPSGE